MPTGGGPIRADALVKKVPKRARQKLSSGCGAKGQRFYDWVVIDLTEPAPGATQLPVRRYPSWARWVTFAMLVHAFLAVVRTARFPFTETR